MRIVLDGERRWWWFGWRTGGGFAFSCELPALSLLALVATVLLWQTPRLTLMAFLPGALAIVSETGTNYIAHGSLRVPYAHRSETDPEDNWYHFTYSIARAASGRAIGRTAGRRSRRAVARLVRVSCLIGHHGIFSLTPIWVLSIAGFGF